MGIKGETSHGVRELREECTKTRTKQIGRRKEDNGVEEKRSKECCAET
jgi:hypothetical protein